MGLRPLCSRAQASSSSDIGHRGRCLAERAPCLWPPGLAQAQSRQALWEATFSHVALEQGQVKARSDAEETVTTRSVWGRLTGAPNALGAALWWSGLSYVSCFLATVNGPERAGGTGLGRSNKSQGKRPTVPVVRAPACGNLRTVSGHGRAGQ